MAKQKQIKPFGTWSSQVTPEMIGDLLEFSELSWSDDGCLLWKERSSNLSSLQSWNPNKGDITNLSGEKNIGGGIMYGGGSYTIQGDRIVIVDKETNQLYLRSYQDQTLTKISQNLRSASTPQISPSGETLIFVHSNGIVDNVKMLKFENSKIQRILLSGADFYNYLRWQPNGSHLAWVSWDHPFIPWDSSQLFLGKLSNEEVDFPSLDFVIKITGGDGISILQPEFSSDGQYLAFISDQDGWWQIYLYHLESGEYSQLTYSQADHGLPPWLQNQCTYGFSPDSQRIYFIRNQLGIASLWQLNLSTGIESPILLDEEYTWMESLAVSPRDQIALVASGGNKTPVVMVTTPDGDFEVIRHSTSEELPQDLFSCPEAISWQDPGGAKIHGLFYKPHNPIYESTGKPPLLIIIHSGPTRQKWAEFQPRTQYFTSRGYAVLEINYRGSTGYGREYWESLKFKWGILDVLDVYNGTRELAERGWIDPNRIALLGSSSGGLTVLRLLVSYPGVYKAGISLYGVTNLLSLVKDPPKFERFYHDWLVGPYPENAKVFQERSPLFSADKIKDPVALFQGGKDPIVPQDQAEEIVKALKENNVPHEYHLYPEEGHGFKKSENVYDFYLKAEAFLQKYVTE